MSVTAISVIRVCTGYIGMLHILIVFLYPNSITIYIYVYVHNALQTIALPQINACQSVTHSACGYGACWCFDHIFVHWPPLTATDHRAFLGRWEYCTVFHSVLQPSYHLLHFTDFSTSFPKCGLECRPLFFCVQLIHQSVFFSNRFVKMLLIIKLLQLSILVTVITLNLYWIYWCVGYIDSILISEKYHNMQCVYYIFVLVLR